MSDPVVDTATRDTATRDTATRDTAASDMPGAADPRVQWSGATPWSGRFDDPYFSLQDGLAEARAVFLGGCGLPQAWAGRRSFTAGELGFGTGLNVLALVDLWRRHRPQPGAILHIFSVEAYPMARSDAARALGAWPELADLSAPLLARWPAGAGLMHRVAWPTAGAILDVALMEAADALAGWSGCADAWMLDGFAPARNPRMWTAEVLAAVAARTAPGGRLATYTAAGAVRRDLQAAGFTVERRPGFAGKRHRTEARRPESATAARTRPARVAIVGAGVAGAALARAFRREGLDPVVIEATGVGAGASGAPVVLVTPRLDAGLGATARLHAQAFGRAVALYEDETPSAILNRGVLQLEAAGRDADRFDRIAAWPAFAPGALVRLSPAEAAARLGEASAPGGLLLTHALTLSPAAVLDAWLEGAERVRADVARLERADEGWRLLDADGAPILRADAVMLAAGPALAGLWPFVALTPVRGQLSLAPDAALAAAAAWGGYATPTRRGLAFGATHARGDVALDARESDHARNHAALAKALPTLAAGLTRRFDGWAGTRAATRDHLPLAGALAEGVFALGGLGGRGFTLAPLLAEAVAALALRRPSPLPVDLARLVDPARRGASRPSPAPALEDDATGR